VGEVAADRRHTRRSREDRRVAHRPRRRGLGARQSIEDRPGQAGAVRLTLLERIQRKVLWLSTYMVHHANTAADGTKVGGHQASSASAVSLLTALYFHALRPSHVVALKAHAAPAFYAIQYLRGRLTAADLQTLRSFGGLQAYPSRRKNPAIVDLSTGSMGLGAVAATFGALGTRYVLDHVPAGGEGKGRGPERWIVMVGDAELDEGNVWEALGEDLLAGLDNVLWIVDVNRQSLDRVVPDARRRQLPALFAAFGWRVIELRYGRRLAALFARRGGDRLRARLDAMPYAEYQSLLRLPPAAIRKALAALPGGGSDAVVDRLLAGVADAELPGLVCDLGGHDLAEILDALTEAERERGRPSVILAHTIKGWGLPLAGDPLNHTALLSQAQIDTLRAALDIAPGEEWFAFPAGSPEAELIAGLPPLFTPPPAPPAGAAVPESVDETYPGETSTQEAFGRVLGALSRRPVADAIVTVSADVAVTTHLAGWINRRGVYAPEARRDFFAEVPQAVRWSEGPRGQHLELGIAEHNLFLLLGALGLAHELSGTTLLPIGTLYDPFVMRGLDALYHALYAGGRFIVVATPSGVSLAPEGGAHQSVITPGIGLAVPGLAYYEPAFAREVEWILLAALRDLATRTGESLYLRLSTRPIDQRLAPTADADHRRRVLRGGYRLLDARRDPGFDPDRAVHLFAAGVMVPEAVAASHMLRDERVFANVFVVTSPDRLYRGLAAPHPYLEELVDPDEEDVPVVSVLDGHPHTLAFIGSALGVTQLPLGVADFGQSGTRADLYRHYGIDAAAIVRAARTLLGG
jgi:pyruvate dehydrogenase E1 component